MEKFPPICAGVTPECPPVPGLASPLGGAEDMVLHGAKSCVTKAWFE